MTLAILFSSKTVESLENGLQTHSGVIPLISKKTESQASSQCCRSVDADAWYKRALMGIRTTTWMNGSYDFMQDLSICPWTGKMDCMSRYWSCFRWCLSVGFGCPFLIPLQTSVKGFYIRGRLQCQSCYDASEYCCHWKPWSHSRLGLQPISSDSTIFNENSITSIIAELLQRWRWHLV